MYPRIFDPPFPLTSDRVLILVLVLVLVLTYPVGLLFVGVVGKISVVGVVGNISVVAGVIVVTSVSGVSIVEDVISSEVVGVAVDVGVPVALTDSVVVDKVGGAVDVVVVEGGLVGGFTMTLTASSNCLLNAELME